MTVIIFVVWLAFTRWGRSERLWPGQGASRSPDLGVDRVPIDATSVRVEMIASIAVLVLTPFTFLSDAFSPLERVGLVALAPFVLRHAGDRYLKLRAGVLAIATEEGLTVPGLPVRTVAWDRVSTVSHRIVSFGPDDFVVKGPTLPIVLDSQFSSLSTDELAAWLTAQVATRS